MNNKNFSMGEVIASLDIGTTKIACCIARILPGDKLEVIGVGYQKSQGIRSGALIDLEALTHAIASAVQSAEQMSREIIKGLFVNISSPLVTSAIYQSTTDVVDHPIESHDIDTLCQAALSQSPRELALIHVTPVSFALDEMQGIRDPQGMIGKSLTAFVHASGIPMTHINNISAAVTRCHLAVYGFGLSPVTSALSCLTEDERELGITVLDIGGGTTSVAVFYHGNPVFTHILPLGGRHITQDIAQGLSVNLSQAERIKVLHGSVLEGADDQRELINIPYFGPEATARQFQTPRSTLINIISPRVEEIFLQVNQCLRDSGYGGVSGAQVVLAGGGSLLQGIKDSAEGILGKQARLAKSILVKGAYDEQDAAALTGVIGVMLHGQRLFSSAENSKQRFDNSGRLKKVFSWVKERF